jgi:hypothetical protein
VIGSGDHPTHGLRSHVSFAPCDLEGFEVRGYVVKGRRFTARILSALPLLLLFACALSTIADAQAVQDFSLPRDPSNQCPCSRGDDAIPVSSGAVSPCLPRIPNLELGFLYYFGNQVRTGRFTADYLFPIRLGPVAVLFGEAHAEGWNFWKRPSGAANNRIDLSLGGGYRTMLSVNSLVGVNGFYDASRLYSTWYSSGGLGLEYAANVAGDDAVDFNLNWYGNLFNRDVLVNAFRNKGNSFDLEAGYSHALFDHALDLRLKLVGYQSDIGDKVYGWRGGADLTTRDGVFTLRYEYGRDRLDGDYNTVGGFVNVGFQLENLLSFESPFTLPEPVFRSPRNLRRMLGLKVKRNWCQPAAVLLSNPCANLHGSLLLTETIINLGRIPFSSFVPQLVEQPPKSSLSYTLCWCKFLNPPQQIRVAFVTSYNLYQSQIILVDSASGCVSDTARNTGASYNPSQVRFVVIGGNNLLFEPGGGISIQFQ